VTTLEAAKTHIRRLVISSLGEYFILDQWTLVPLLGSAQIDHPSVESGHHGPRVGMGEKRVFPRLGVLRVCVGIQIFGIAHRNTIDEMKRSYERQRDEVFKAHVCAQYPKRLAE